MFTFVGLMHAPSLALNATPDFTIGYIAMALLFGVCAMSTQKNKKFDNQVM